MGFQRRCGGSVCPAEVSLDIHLAEDLSKEGFSDLILELFRFLLQQRHQIPVPYSTLLQDIREQKRAEEEEEKGDENGEIQRLSPRERRERIRLLKKKARFLKKAEAFSVQLEDMSKDLKSEILEKDLLSAFLFFGATPVTPKEVYHVHFPPLSSHSGSSLTPKVKRQIFRSLVTHEELFSLLGRPLPLTNTFTALKFRYLQSPSAAFRSRPHKLGRGRIVHLNFILPHTLSTPGTNMKRRRALPRYTPVPMDICTPFTITKSIRKGGRKRPLSALRRLQADFQESNLLLEKEEERTEESSPDSEEAMEGLAPLHGGPIEDRVLTPSSSCIDTLLDSHQEKWFVSARHLKGIK